MDNSNSKKQKFQFFKRYSLSITNISAYSTFTREPLSKAIRYFFLLVLILSIIPFLLFCKTLHSEINDFADWLSKNLPNMSIKEGVLSCEVEQPIKLKYRDFINLIIDTKDTISRIDPEYDACILLNSRKISLKFMQNTPHSVYIPEDLSLDINPQTIDNYKRKLFLTLIPFAALILYIVPLLQKSLEVIFFSLLLSIVYASFCMRKKIPNPGKLKDFSAACIYAITAPFTIEIIFGISGFNFKYFMYLYYAIYIYYIFQVFLRVIIYQHKTMDNVGGENS
ncbi:DUF1189 domain-containing protein [bacterium]|nr:DUF1189 domain-containing protein [bacterium]